MLLDSLISPTDSHVETSKVARNFENNRYNNLSVVPFVPKGQLELPI